MRDELEKKAVYCFLGNYNTEIVRNNGKKIILVKGSFNFFNDPYTGKDFRGKLRCIYKKEIFDLNPVP